MSTSSLSLEKVLQAAGFSQVIWIDDLFNKEPIYNTVESIEVALATALADLQPILHRDQQALSDSTFKFTADTDIEPFIALLREADDSGELAQRWITLVRAKKRQLATHGSEVDYGHGQIGQIIASLGDKIEQVGFDVWSSKREATIGKLTRQTLLIVDREENGVSVGDSILRELMGSNPDALIIMLTHSVDSAQAAAELAQQLDADKQQRHRFTVMAKSPSEAELQKYLQYKIREIVTRYVCNQLVKDIEKLMHQAVNETGKMLLDFSLETLDVMLFQNSIEEGASEIDVLVRLLSLRQRVGVENSIIQNGILAENAKRVRALHNLEVALPKSHLKDRVVAEAASLQSWRFDEIFDPLDRINRTNQPLACGDIFKSSTNRYFLLLAQPCDIAVRRNGARAFEEGIFVEIKVLEPGAGSATSEPPRDEFRLPGLPNETGSWAVRFQRWASVNLCCLDLAVFDGDGMVRFTSKIVESPWLLLGWQKRFDKLKSALKPKASNIGHVCPSRCLQLSFSDRIPARTPTLEKDENDQLIGFSYPYQRVGRLRSPWSTAVHVAFSTWRTRTAFEHDFSKNVGSPDGEAGMRSSMESPDGTSEACPAASS